MKLEPAHSPEIRAAHMHTYVQTTVDILMRDWDLLRTGAAFLKKYYSYDQPGFKENLAALRLNRSRPNSDGIVVAPEYVIKLTETLLKMYQQSDKHKVGYHRGAIVERLVYKLICHRYTT